MYVFVGKKFAEFIKFVINFMSVIELLPVKRSA